VWAVDLLLALLVIGPAIAPFLPSALRPDSVLSWVTALAPAGILPLRRRWPMPVLGVLMVLFAIAAFQGTLLPGVGLAIAATVFHIANTRTRRASLIVGGVVILLIASVSLIAAVTHGLDPLLFQFVVTVAFASAAGDATRSRREYLIAVTERADRAERTRESEARRRVTEERLRIARDLHDAVAHQIAVISLNAGVASSSLDSTPERTRTALLTIRQASRTVLGEIGDLLSMLRAAEQEDSDTAPQYGLEHIDALLEQFASSGLDVHRRVEGDPSRVTGAVALVAYRVIQEALTNAHKHGTGHRAYLLVDVNAEMLRIIVTNPSEQASAIRQDSSDSRLSGNGLGMLGLRERVASVRGEVETGPAPGGWKLTATIPLPTEGRA
jgi:signal transduction histidine kinase